MPEGCWGLEYQFSISVDLVRGLLGNRLGYVLSTNIASFVFFFVFVIKNAVIFSNATIQTCLPGSWSVQLIH